MSSESSDGRCAVVAVLGAPNAGKSSLVNALVGAKVSIVTHKVQTTRTRVRGVAVEGSAQLVFIDTPGIFAPRRRLDRAMVAAAWSALEGADFALLLVDAPAYLSGAGAGKAAAAARRAAADTDALIAALKGRAPDRQPTRSSPGLSRRSMDARDKRGHDGGDVGEPLQAKTQRGPSTILVLNKVDKIARPKLLELTQRLNEHGAFTDTFYVSATRGEGVPELKSHLAENAPAGPWLYPEDQLSDISERMMAAEVTREKLYLRLHQELPYEATVETDAWSRTNKGELRVEQTIYVAREGQKPIVLGKGGQTLKSIGAAARAELAELLGGPVHLFLHVKVREDWAEDPTRFRALGLEWSK